MGLRTRFNLAMLAAFAVGLALASALSWQRMRDIAGDEMVEEARLIAGEAAAIRAYTVAEIEPLLAAQSHTRFLPHTIPAFAARTTQRDFSRHFPAYTYREAVLDPTNPADKATEEEAAIISRFRQSPDLHDVIWTQQTPAGEMLSIAIPERVTRKECLACHSTPEEAPATMVDIYGRDGGFGWQLGMTVGAQIVSVPKSVALDRAWLAFVSFTGLLSATFAVALLLLNMLLYYTVVKPVRAISAHATEVSTGAASGEIEVHGADEIAALARSFNRMSHSVAEAIKMLEHRL